MTCGFDMADRELSRKPKEIRDRLRRGRDPARDLAMLQDVSGYHKPLSEWDLEELGRGYPRDSNGSFTGRRTPSWLVGPLQEERMRRLKTATHDALMTHAAAAMRVIGELIADPKTPASVRADIGKFIYEQQHGKATSKVDVGLSAKDQTMQVLASAIVLDDGLPQDHLAIESELAEDHKEEMEADRAMIGLDDD